MKHDIALPRWVQLGLASAFLAVPVTAAITSLAGNIHYNIQFGLAAVVIYAATDIARIVLPVMAEMMFGWKNWIKVVMIPIVVACGYCAINYVSDSRFQDLFTRSEVSSTYTDSKSEIERLVTALSNIRETSTPAALEGQITTKTSSVADLRTLVEDHSNPKKRGPCKDVCEGIKRKLEVEQAALGSLQERLGQANTKLELTAQLKAARTTKSTTATEVKDGGLASVLAWAGVSSKSNLDMGSVFINAVLYLLLVEGLCYLMAPAATLLLRTLYAKAEEVAVVADEEVKFTKTSHTVTTQGDEITVFEDVAPEAAITFSSAALLPFAEEPVAETTVEPVVALAEPEVAETPIVEAAPVAKKATARKRDQWGRFVKPKKLPKPKAAKAVKPKAVKKPKLKLADLPRPQGENVVDLVSLGKLPRKD